MTPQDIYIIGLQILLPLSLVVWFWAAPAESGLGYGTQCAAIALSLTALCLVPVWLIPPWWTPFPIIVLFLSVAVGHIIGRQSHRSRLWPNGYKAWALAIASVFLGVSTGAMCVSAVTGRYARTENVIDLVFPMASGIYLVANGGATESVNSHFLTLYPKTERQRNYRGQSFGVDLVKVDRMGLRALGWRPRDPRKYEIFGEPVYAPCVGKVVSAVDGRPDMSVPERDTTLLEGNHVFLDCGGFGVLLAHFRNGSIGVAVGDEVFVGQRIAEVGNSGQSTEPHLHIHAQTLSEAGPLLSGEPLFITLNGRFAVRNDRITIIDEN